MSINFSLAYEQFLVFTSVPWLSCLPSVDDPLAKDFDFRPHSQSLKTSNWVLHLELLYHKQSYTEILTALFGFLVAFIILNSSFIIFLFTIFIRAAL